MHRLWFDAGVHRTRCVVDGSLCDRPAVQFAAGFSICMVLVSLAQSAILPAHMARPQTFSIRHHGRTIVGDLYMPKGRAARLPSMLFVHGYLSHRRDKWFRELYEKFVAHGFAVLTIDLNGHGESSGDFRDFTYTRAIEDVMAAARYLEQYPHINPYKIIGIGHSLGGTALMFAKARGIEFRTLALLAPVGDTTWHYAHHERYPKSELAAWRRTGLYTWYEESLGRTLSLRYSFWKDLKTLDSLAVARTLRQPVFIAHGESDRAVPFTELQRLFKAIRGPSVLRRYASSGHSFWDARDRRTLYRDLFTFIREYHPVTVAHGVAVFIRHGDQYLTLKRSNKVGQHKGRWAVVAGYLPKGEVPVAHAYEEALEEAGLHKKDLTLVKVGTKVLVHDPITDVRWRSTPVLFESSTKRIKLNWENTAYRWVPISRMPFDTSYPGLFAQWKALHII